MIELSPQRAPLMGIFGSLALFALISIGFSIALALGVHRSWQSSTPPLVLTALLLSLLTMIAFSYTHLRDHLKASAELHDAAIATAHRDPLTGTANRSLFLLQLRNRLPQGRITPGGMLLIDMDGLKILNDTLGHKAGDAAIIHLVRTIREVAPEALIGRLGGDEFAVLIENVTEKQATVAVASAILDALARSINIDGRPHTVTATIGVVQFPEDGDCCEALLASADLALYRGKMSGRRSVVAFDLDMLIDERHRRFIERELRAAILMGELEVFYQPIVHATSGRIAYFEALVRWNHSLRGLISPGDFVPIAEQSPLIDLLGDWVLRRVCEDFPLLETSAVAINVSPVQLRRPYFAGDMLAILRQRGIACNQIIVEVTENAKLSTGGTEMSNLRALHEAGIRIAIDDFGAGHASLHYLREVPFNTIKIDRSYADGLLSEPVNGGVVAAICMIGRAQGADIVGEGVETEEQRALLLAAGCTHLQGYFFGRPRPMAEIMRQANAREREIVALAS